MISGRTSTRSFFSATAASMIARVCISMISGKSRPSRQPRSPSIGFCSCRFCTAASSFTLSAYDFSGLPSACARVTSTSSSSSDGRNSCNGGSMSRMITGSPCIALRMPWKSPRCIGSNFASSSRAFRLVGGEDHLLHDRQAFLLHEHVLGAAEADALRAELARAHRVMRVVAVRPHFEAPERVRPAQNSSSSPEISGIEHRDLAGDDVARRAVDGEGLAFLDRACRRR